MAAPAGVSTETAGPKRSRLSRVFHALGPGLVFALTVGGPGSFVTNAAAGAMYGYALVWALGLTVVFRYVWMSSSAKYVLITGESLVEGYRRIARWLPWTVFGSALLIRHVSNMYKVVLLGGCLHLLLPLPFAASAAVWSIISVCLAFSMVFWGGYPVIEKCCKFFVALMSAGLAIAAVLSKADPVAMLRAAIFPKLPENQAIDALLLVMALIGTDAGSLTNVTYSYFLRAKGWRSVEYLRRQRIDLLGSVVCIFCLGALVQVTAAASIHPLGIRVGTVEDLMRVFSTTLGAAGRVIFSVGLWASAFAGYVGGMTGYGLIVTDVYRTSGRAPERRAAALPADPRRDPVFRWSVVFWSFSPLYVLLTKWEPVTLVIVLNTLMVVLIPVLAWALLRLTNDRERMGRHANHWATKTVFAVLIATAIFLMARNLIVRLF